MAESVRDRSRSPSGRASASASLVKELVGQNPVQCKIRFVTKEGLAASQGFKAQKGDVFISSYPKTGTTWVQQLCHQLRTGGDADFDEITEEGIVPWLETGPSLGINLDAPQKAAPRCFKTHQPLSHMSHMEEAGAKYLCVLREPEATLLSFFKFELGHNHPAVAARDINVFVQSKFVVPGGGGSEEALFGASYWDFCAEFWRCRHLPHVKLMVYEHMRKDLASQVDSLAEFLGVPAPSEDIRAVVLENCSMQWMSRNDNLFDDHYIGKRLQAIKSETPFQSVTKVGHVIKNDNETNTVLSDESRELLRRMWKERMEPVCGFSTYAEMIAAL